MKSLAGLLAAGAWLLGCTAAAPKTVIACAADGTCPAGTVCVSGVCLAGQPVDAQTAGADAAKSADAVAGDAAETADTLSNFCGEPPDPSGGPSARGDVAAGFAGGKLIVLYGDEGAPVQCQPAPKYAKDAYVFDPCKGWAPLTNAPMPPPRARAALAYDRDNDALWLYGGRFRAGSSGNYTNYGDLWRYGGADGQFLQVDDGKSGPAARSNACIGYHRQTQTIYVFGGNTSASGLNYAVQNDLWKYDPSGGGWSKLKPSGTPPAARLFHSCAITDDGKSMVVFGGGGADALTGSFYGDTSILDIDALKWSQVAGPGPKARIKAGMAPAHDSAHVWLFGGHDDGSVGNRNDLWSFSVEQKTWVARFKGDLGQGGDPDQINKSPNGFCDFPPDFMQLDKQSPERREAMGMTADAQGNLWVFGGKSDCGALRDVWKYDVVTTLWQNWDDTSTGWSCDRYKKPCQTLCN